MVLQILFEETLYQKSSKETLLVELLKEKNIIPGIKVGIWTACTTQLLLESRFAHGQQSGSIGQRHIMAAAEKRFCPMPAVWHERAVKLLNLHTSRILHTKASVC